MSNQLGTSRATRTNKEKHARSTVVSNQAPQIPPSKTEKPVPKNQATVEQMRMAQMIDSGKETANIDTVKQLCEMTGRSEEDVVVALHDAQDDPDRAVSILIDGEQGQGEWEVQDKKKKRSSTLKSEKEMSRSPVQENDRGEPRSDRSRDRHDMDKHDGPPRRGRDRRNGGPPPRLANRGRGRERNSYRGDRDRDRGGYGNRSNFNDQNDRSNCNEVETVNGEEDWGAEIIPNNDFREQRSSKDYREQRRGDRDRGFDGDRDRGFGGDRDRGYGDRDRGFGGDRERGFGGDRDRSYGDRDRGRGFGGNRGRGRGRGGFGRPGSRGGRPRRYDRNDSNEGPHIDTWTNETAENAEKENSGWGETWGETTEDLCEDQWTGSLEDTKVFTPSQTKASVEPDLTTNVSDSTNTIGQRLDVGSLFSKSAEFAKAPDFTKTGEPTSGDSFFASYNQQAAESIKNSIGIGSSSARQNLSNMPASVPQSLGTLPAMPQRDISHAQGQPSRSSVPSMLPQSTSTLQGSMHPSSTSSAPPSMLPPASAAAHSAPVSTPPLAQPAQPQQRRQQRSKLPPPSKIPASAVEMPGHAMPQLDVQFDVEFGAESSQFGFGPSGNTSTSYSTSSPAPSSSVPNHLGEANKSQPEPSRQGAMMSSPPAGSHSSQSSMPNMEASPSRPSVFPDSVYSSPSKSESPANKVAESAPFQSPAPEHKPSSLMTSQRTSQSNSSMPQSSLSTSKPERDSSNMPNFSVANGYAANSYPTHSQSHKPSSSSSPSQSYRQTGPVSQTSVASYSNQFSSQTQYSGASGTQQNQYPSSGQGQFPGSQGQFPAAGSGGSSAPAPSQFLPGQSQYPSGSQGSFPSAPVVTQGQYQAGGSQYHTNYQPSSVSFQSAQNPLYPSTTQQSGGSYPSGSGSFHVRDSQSSGTLQQSVVNLQQAPVSLQPSVVNLQQPSGNLQQSVGTLAAPAVSQPNNSYQNQQPAPGLTKATTTQSTNAFNTQTYTGPHAGQHAQPTTTQSPSAYNSQTYSSQHSSLHSQATTTQSPTSYSTQQAYSAQHSSQHGQATTTQSPSAYNTQTFSAQHAPQQNLQTSPLGNKLGDSLSKMSIKESAAIESRTSQYDHANNSSTTVSLTSSSSTTTNTSSISTATSTVSATSAPVVTTSTLASRVTTSIPLTTKAPPNLPPGVPLVNPHLFMGQAAAASGIPPYFAGLQQPLYGYEELQMMQPARLPLQTGNFYDLAAYSGVPSTIAAGRDQAAALGTAPFTGAATDNKQLNRLEAQSPNQSTQQQSTHSAPQQTVPFNIHYSYFYPGAMLPGAAGFQYPTMFPIPPVTNTAAAHVPGTTTAAQLPKTYGSHQGFPTKGTGTTADIGTGAYPKSHAQGFDKQGFPAGTPPPFSLPLANASQAGPLGAPAAPYGAPFLPMMPPQPHNQTLLHHAMPQDSGTGSNRGLQQPTNQGKPAAAKNNYYSNWN